MTNSNDTGACITGTWPAWGDIVIMTIRSERPTMVLHTASYATFDATTMQYVRGQGGGTQTLPESAGAAYHEYAVEWGPERIEPRWRPKVRTWKRRAAWPRAAHCTAPERAP